MKKSILLLSSIILFAGCNTLFTSNASTDQEQPIVPLRINTEEKVTLLTDFLPAWTSADSITSEKLEIQSEKDDWSEFLISIPEQFLVNTFQAWREGKSTTIVTLSGERRGNLWIYSKGGSKDKVQIYRNSSSIELLAMWQNNKIDQSDVNIESDNLVNINIPKEAKKLKRSWLRVYGADEFGRSNDLLIPLEYGKIVESAKQLDRFDRQKQVMYSLMIDRFMNGNPNNDAPLNDPEVIFEVDYQGGDIKGITKKIEDGFFKDLGINTIWISPITQNPRDAWGLNENPRTKFSGYHGYWPIYMTQIDDRFGSDAELKEMLDVAHKNDMNVVLDYVANHLHINSPVLKANPDWITELMLPDGRENIHLWDEQRLTTWFDKHIPTLDLEREEVREVMTDSAMFWIANYDFDGFRHDACKHIPESYWRLLTSKIKSNYPHKNIWQIGETYGSNELVGSYIQSGMIDAQFDFSVYHTALDVLGYGGSMERIANAVADSESAFGSHHTMGNITGNHDKSRFISIAGGDLTIEEDHKIAGMTREVVVGDSVAYDRLGLMNLLIATIPGVPCIYQGDEYGEPGGNDPDNRRMMRFDSYIAKEQELRDRVSQFMQLRQSSMPLLYGDLKTLYLDDDCWIFLRVYMGKSVIVAMNIGDESKEISVNTPDEFISSSDKFEPLLSYKSEVKLIESDNKIVFKILKNGFVLI